MKTKYSYIALLKLSFICLLLCFSSVLIKAQNPHWNHFGGYYYVPFLENNGNYIWAGTNKDIIKLNQNDSIIERYSYDGGTGYSYLLSMTTDKNSDLWLCYEYSGIYHLHNSTWTNITNFPSTAPNFIQFDTLNRLWIANWEGLWLYDGTNYSKYDSTNSTIPGYSNTYDFKIDKNNNIWVATSKGLVKYDGTNWFIYNTVKRTQIDHPLPI